MSSSQPTNTHYPNQPKNFGAQMPLHQKQGDPTSSREIGPNDAPRTRSSAFGMQYGNSGVPSPPLNAPQPLFAQHSGPVSAHSSSSPAGPSNSRNSSTPQNTASPIQHAATAGPTQVGSPTTGRPSTSSKSPFTTPITCPPRTRLNQVLLVNPTSTIPLTNLLLNTLRPILPSALEVTAYNAPFPAPTAIESTVDSVLSSETVLRDLAKYTTNNGETVQNYDALLIASYSKHPLIDALRESYDVPVIGIMEASLYVARMLGGRFGIISTSTRMKLQIDDAVHAYGLSHYYIGVESLHINPIELLSSSFVSTATNANNSNNTANPTSDSSSQVSSPSTLSRSKEELQRRLVTQSKALVSKGADTVILGSEFLSSNEAIRIVKDAVRDEDGRRTVNVVDAIEAGILMVNGLIGMGVPTSKKGVFRGERDTRRARGQTWL